MHFGPFFTNASGHPGSELWKVLTDGDGFFAYRSKAVKTASKINVGNKNSENSSNFFATVKIFVGQKKVD
jgi:hypothetical protein